MVDAPAEGLPDRGHDVVLLDAQDRALGRVAHGIAALEDGRVLHRDSVLDALPEPKAPGQGRNRRRVTTAMLTPNASGEASAPVSSPNPES